MKRWAAILWRRLLFLLRLQGVHAPERIFERARRRLDATPPMRRAMKRWALRIGAAFLAVNLLWLTAAASLAYLWPLAARLGGDEQWLQFERIADRARAAALYDAKGRYFGILSAGFERDHLGGLSQSQIDEAEIIPDHKAIPLEDAPRYFWRCIAWLEDRHRGTWDNPFGISFRGVAQIPYRTIGASLAAGRFRLSGGGSTLEMQLARSLWQQYRHNSNPLLRKLREWRAAPVLNDRLIEDGDERRFRSWIAQHLALIQAAGGEQDVYGVEEAGRLLFGKPAAELDAAEQFILAAAVRRPLRLRAGAESRRAELARFIGTPENPERALLCASPDAVFEGAPVIEDEALRETTATKLTRIASEPFEGPTVEPALRPYAQALIEHPSGPRLDPQRLAADLAYGLEVEAQAGLADAFAPPQEPETRRHLWRGHVAGLRLTVDLPKNLALEKKIAAAIATVEKRAGVGDPPRLAAGVLGAPGRGFSAPGDPAEDPALWTTPYVAEHGERVPLLVVAADAQGRVVRLVNTSGDSLWSGAAAARADWGFYGEGPYQPGRERRLIASLGKIGASMLLAEAGIASPRHIFNNRCGTGFTHRCGGAGWPNRVTARQAFAQSLNAAVTNALASRVPNARIDAFARSLGFGDAGAGEQADPMPPPARLALGRYAARPLAVQTMIAAAFAYAEGDFDAHIPIPHLIEAYLPFDPEEDRARGESFSPFGTRGLALSDIARPGADPDASAAFVRDVLQAPLCDQGKDGLATLRRLRAWCAIDNPELRLHLAKTGTLGATEPVAGYNEADWWIAGALELADGRRYSYVVAAGAGAPSAPFARDLGAGRLAPVVDALLRDLLENG